MRTVIILVLFIFPSGSWNNSSFRGKIVYELIIKPSSRSVLPQIVREKMLEKSHVELYFGRDKYKIVHKDMLKNKMTAEYIFMPELNNVVFVNHSDSTIISFNKYTEAVNGLNTRQKCDSLIGDFKIDYTLQLQNLGQIIYKSYYSSQLQTNLALSNIDFSLFFDFENGCIPIKVEFTNGSFDYEYSLFEIQPTTISEELFLIPTNYEIFNFKD